MIKLHTKGEPIEHVFNRAMVRKAEREAALADLWEASQAVADKPTDANVRRLQRAVEVIRAKLKPTKPDEPAHNINSPWAI